MRKEEKSQIVETIATTIKAYDNFYLTDIATLNAEKTSQLRAECFKSDIKLLVVKNTLLQKALETLEGDYTELAPALKGNTAIMFSNVANAPAKLIDKYKKEGVPSLKAAYVQESFYVGANNLPALVNIKSKNELIGDVIGLLQSPIKNVMSSLQSGGNTIHGVLETLSKR
ncbi:large subunit ribosomal protein L10 [Dysgonomonas sp. PH5-45]|uniref:50S ribosomal protein L10 n=1 Tax=unclassified Dysgonomonas TaxID=2630389 RepID=UPI002474EED6|nr:MULTISPECIES: 50S ribosomal protein L10 [unclassified Dysgonomonas]MDH6354120.1 large subunit ribosomal protein L10 [Dysgonomonas sp. PH5-45]MDH6387029.1 large subunit ribosomal protein L10 [Dysgonomonas sp. PH5-37]